MSTSENQSGPHQNLTELFVTVLGRFFVQKSQTQERAIVWYFEKARKVTRLIFKLFLI